MIVRMPALYEPIQSSPLIAILEKVPFTMHVSQDMEKAGEALAYLVYNETSQIFQDGFIRKLQELRRQHVDLVPEDVLNKIQSKYGVFPDETE